MMIEQQATRQVVLDTETTGMNQEGGPHYQGHRIIEVGCVEVVNRRLTGNHFHVYVKPDRPVDEEAIRVHGITDEFLADKPDFSAVAEEFLEFIRGAELVIHNAPFDVGFMDHEFGLLGLKVRTREICQVTDTLVMAKKEFPGKRNNLDALCDRYGIDNSRRTLHGALLDAEILADVYLLMTGGQTRLDLSLNHENDEYHQAGLISGQSKPRQLRIVQANTEEIAQHQARLDIVEKEGGRCLWRS